MLNEENLFAGYIAFLFFLTLPLGVCFLINFLSTKDIDFSIVVLQKTIGGIVMGLFLGVIFFCLAYVIYGLIYSGLGLLNLDKYWNDQLETIVFEKKWGYLLILIFTLTGASQFLLSDMLSLFQNKSENGDE